MRNLNVRRIITIAVVTVIGTIGSISAAKYFEKTGCKKTMAYYIKESNPGLAVYLDAIGKFDEVTGKVCTEVLK